MTRSTPPQSAPPQSAPPRSTPPLTETLCEDPRWQAAGLPALAERTARAVLDHLDLSGPWDIAVLGCDDARIAALNGDFRDKPRATNVLSWPETNLAPDRPGAEPARPVRTPHESHLGDIAIAWDTCQREAQEQRKSADAHVTHLLVHGILHLLGYDHQRDADATLMERHEVAILGKLGLPDPYTVMDGPQTL